MERDITVVTLREQYVNESTGFLERQALILCLPAWVSLEAEPEPKASMQVVYLGMWSKGTGTEHREGKKTKLRMCVWVGHGLDNRAQSCGTFYGSIWNVSQNVHGWWRKETFISSHLPLVKNGPRVWTPLHFEPYTWNSVLWWDIREATGQEVRGWDSAWSKTPPGCLWMKLIKVHIERAGSLVAEEEVELQGFGVVSQ